MIIIKTAKEWNEFVRNESSWDDEEFVQTPEKYPCMVRLRERVGKVRFVDFIYHDEAKAFLETTKDLCLV